MLLTIVLLLVGMGMSVMGLDPDCLVNALNADRVEWQANLDGSEEAVEWLFGNTTCSSVNECFGFDLQPDTALDAQIPPIQIQKGLTLKFWPTKSLDATLFILPYRVDEEAFGKCDISKGTPIIPDKTDEEFVVKEEFLQTGSNYFISEAFDSLYRCEFGLRLNVTVKESNCTGLGETVACWNHGRCLTTPWQVGYSCECCDGYSGVYCDNPNACIEQPCRQNATCLDLHNDPSGDTFRCICPGGFYGVKCDEEAENLCEANPCINAGVCDGNDTMYVCHCPKGYAGHHCEVNINECASQPCGPHGVCVDKEGGFQCYCKPGYRGRTCADEYDECTSNPCQHDGYCVDMEDDYSCQCYSGYTGKHCELKVDLCNPSRCENATDCIDRGHNYSCTCEPGFHGHHCEVNINECESNPCQNGGKCFDEIAGYVCKCSKGYLGNHCEYMVQPPPRDDLGYTTMFHERSQMSGLVILAVTLSGALLIALLVLAGCYCKNNNTYSSINSKSKGYSRHEDVGGTATRVATVDSPALSADAIMEASSNTTNSMNAPLVASLRSKRV